MYGNTPCHGTPAAAGRTAHPAERLAAVFLGNALGLCGEACRKHLGQHDNVGIRLHAAVYERVCPLQVGLHVSPRDVGL